MTRAEQFRLLLLSAAVGFVVGCIGAAFRVVLEDGYALFAWLLRADPLSDLPGWLLAPVAGAALVLGAVYLTRRFAPEAAGSGIQEIEGALDGLKPPPRWRRVIPVKFFAGILAMSSGLVIGREGPTIHLGGAFGAMAADLSRATREHADTLIAAGAGCGLAAAFNAPVAGILFVFEETRHAFRFTALSVQCVILASVAATVGNDLIAGPGFTMELPSVAPASFPELAVAIGLGVVLGASGAAMNAAILHVTAALEALRTRVGWAALAAVTGAGIGLLVWGFEDATGGGEGLARRMLLEPGPVGLLALLVAARTVVFLISFGSAVPGGIFAPQLAFGALLGLLAAAGVEALAPGLDVAQKLGVAGMVGLVAATVRAPLTAIALVVEMTGNVELLLMLLLVAVVADTTAEWCGGRPIFSQLLERELRAGVEHPGRDR